MAITRFFPGPPGEGNEDSRLRQIENFLCRIHEFIGREASSSSTTFQSVIQQAAETGTSPGGGGGASTSIDESRVNFDSEAGHSHDNVDSNEITIAGDVTGTNLATTVVKLRGVDLAPTSVASPADGAVLVFDGSTTDYEASSFTRGEFGIAKTAAPTARLHIGAGAATANDGQVKYDSSTFLTTPEAGVQEFDGFRLAFTPAAIRKFEALTSAHVTSTTTVANTVAATTVFTGAIAANTVTTGQTYVARVLGRYSTANATDTVALAIKVGASVTVFTVTTTAAAVANAAVMLDFAFTVRTTGAGGTAWGFVEAETNAVNKSQAGTATFALDSTAAADVTVVATWSAADVGNSLSIDMGWLAALG